MIDLGDIKQLTKRSAIDFDLYVDKFHEIIDYLILNGYDDYIDRVLYDFLTLFYQYYNLLEDTPTNNSYLGVGTYKKELTEIYYNSLLDIYNDKKITLAPYSNLCKRLANLFVEKIVSCDWFTLNWETKNATEFSHAFFLRKIGIFEKNKRIKSIKDLQVEYDDFLEFLILVQDYAFHTKDMTSTNDGDKAFCMIITKSIAPVYFRNDEKGYLREGLKYYLRDMRNYKLM